MVACWRRRRFEPCAGFMVSRLERAQTQARRRVQLFYPGSVAGRQVAQIGVGANKLLTGSVRLLLGQSAAGRCGSPVRQRQLLASVGNTRTRPQAANLECLQCGGAVAVDWGQNLHSRRPRAHSVHSRQGWGSGFATCTTISGQQIKSLSLVDECAWRWQQPRIPLAGNADWTVGIGTVPVYLGECL